MKQATVIIRDQAGLHARPAALIMSAVNKYQSRVRLETTARGIDLKNIIDILKLDAVRGDKILITCEGEDEEKCLSALVEIFETLSAGN